MATSTSRTLARLRKDGWTAGVVEKWIPQTKRRLDFLGIIDVIACHPTGGILGIQSTAGSANMSHRIAKALAEPRLKKWLEAGGRFRVYCWDKKGPRGKRKTWQVRIKELHLEDFLYGH
jgi:hypothetical protein